MNLLFVHQNFPGQYRHIVRALAAEGRHRIVALSLHPPAEPLPPQVVVVRYRVPRGNQQGIDPLLLETDTKLIRARGCAAAALRLLEQGFVPDLICGHPGWGELLFLGDVWPDVPILTYQEFFYQNQHSDLDFDPEFQPPPSWEARARTRMKNANVLLNLQASSWCVTPTGFQRSTFPANWQQRISVIHDGIDTGAAHPDDAAPPLELPGGRLVQRSDQLVTFVNRHLEPYRGCHSLIRAIPRLQQLAPKATLVIVGEEQGVSYGRACPSGSWKDRFLAEIAGSYDPSRVLFTGSLPYPCFLQLLRLSAVHVYLTYPFVLSWSLLEAMSSGCAVVGSATAPVQEVIHHNQNGLLVDFFQPGNLATAIAELLEDRSRAAALGQAARQTILNRYSLERCLPQQLSLIRLVTNRAVAV